MYRLYVRQWVTVHTEQVDTRLVPDPPGPLYVCLSAARDWVQANLKGVADADVSLDASTNNTTMLKVNVDVHKEVLVGEYNQPWAAEQMAEISHFEDYTIVLKGSVMDREIEAYGAVR